MDTGLDQARTVSLALAGRAVAARARRVWSGLLLVAAASAALSGCTPLGEYIHNGFKVGPNYRRPPAETAPEWIDAADARVRSDSAADCAWWTLLDDPVLNGLIETAYRQNLDLRSAGARIIEARAQRQVAVGNLFPQAQSVDIAALQAQISQNLPIPLPAQLDLWAAGLNGSWELDVWGRYRRTVESADAKLGAAVEGYGEVLVLMLSEVATNYIQLRTYQQRLAFARNNVAIQRGSLRLAEARLKQGVSNELDLRQARSNVWQTEALIPVFEAGAREASNALCTLLAMAPQDLASQLQPAPIPKAPREVAVGYPAQLLARRPDIRHAEREVADQCARLGIASADLYPALAINGYVGFWGQSFDDLFKGDSFTGFFLPQFRWNVLNYGRIANNIMAQDARLQSLVYDYQQTVLKAGQEVENALVRYLQTQRRAEYLRNSVNDAARAVELVQLQFEGGTTDFNRVYTVQAFLTSQQDQLAEAEGSIALNLVGVYKALGGGWNCFVACCGLPAPCHPPGVVGEESTAPPAAEPPGAEAVPAPPLLQPPSQAGPNAGAAMLPPPNPKRDALLGGRMPFAPSGPLSPQRGQRPGNSPEARFAQYTAPLRVPPGNPPVIPVSPASSVQAPPLAPQSSFPPLNRSFPREAARPQ